MKFSNDNAYPLYALHKGKLYRVEHFSFSKKETDDLGNDLGLLTVSVLSQSPKVDLMVSPNKEVIPSPSFRQNMNKFYRNLFIKVFDQFFQVAFISTSQDECNDYMNKNKETGLICSTNMRLNREHHIIASCVGINA